MLCDIEKTARLNDAMRTGYFTTLGEIRISTEVSRLGDEHIHAIWHIVATYDDFSPLNDPLGKREFGVFDFEGSTYYWKIDYYNKNLTASSEDPSDPEITTRVMTIMQADEY